MWYHNCMSNDVNVVDKNPVGSSVVSGQVQPQSLAKEAVLDPMGGVRKENAPIGSVSEIRPAGPEVKHEITQELTALGAEEKQDRPDLTSEHR